MKARLKHILEDGEAYGVTLTLIVALLAAGGYLQTLEDWFYDRRAAYCQLFMPLPTDRLVHLDIDDATLDSLGDWPWPRSTIGEITDEIRQAGPKALAFDIVFHDLAPLRYVKQDDGQFVEINDDDRMAAAISRGGNVLIPLSISPQPPQVLTPLERRLAEALNTDLELTEATAPAELLRRGMGQAELQRALKPGFVDALTRTRRSVMYHRLIREMRSAPMARDQLRKRLFPHTEPVVQTAATRLFDELFGQAESQLAMENLERSVPGDFPRLLHAENALTPVAALARAARTTACIDVPKGGDGIVRRLPLLMEYDGKIYPQLGLQLAAMMLDADLRQCRYSHGKLSVIRHGGAPIELPVDSVWSESLKQEIPMMFDIPMFGQANNWEGMYDKVGGGHIPLNEVWDACLTRRRLSANNRNADNAIDFILNGDPNLPNDSRLGLAPERAVVYSSRRPDLEDFASRREMMNFAVKTLDESKYIEMFASIADPKPEEKKRLEDMRATRGDLQTLLTESARLEEQLKSQRAVLRKRLADRAVLVGWTATAQAADQVGTSLHTRCPAVVLHGLIFNAIMTGKTLSRVPPWIDIGIILLMGLLATVLATRLAPIPALFFSLLLATVYVLLNGTLLYDFLGLIVTLAGPLIVVSAVWAGCTLARLLHESLERNRIALETAGLRREMDLAKRAQEALIPREPPGVHGLDAVGWTMPASTTGGDCFDLWKMNDGRLGILLADASGHGLGPAMIVTQVRTLVRALCELEAEPHQLLGRVNGRLNQDLEGGNFVTAFLGFLSVDGELHWSSAGHGPVFARTEVGAELIELDPPALPLGIIPEWDESPPPPISIGDGGLILLCSDGIFEAPAPNKEMFGVPRMIRTIEVQADNDSSKCVKSLSEAVRIWYAGSEPVDDQTIVIVRRQGTVPPDESSDVSDESRQITVDLPGQG